MKKAKLTADYLQRLFDLQPLPGSSSEAPGGDVLDPNQRQPRAAAAEDGVTGVLEERTFSVSQGRNP